MTISDTFIPWIVMLREHGGRILRDAPEPRRTSPALAEAGFLRWRRGETGPAPAGAAGDALLWWALLDPDTPLPTLQPGRSPLFPQDAYDTIEVWTESDLCAMHALWRVGAARRAPELRRRALDAASWHVEHIQPDNATNRPWAVHVFLDLWRTSDDPGARLHAETLLHNALAGARAPDHLIGQILLDAADALETPPA